MAASHYAASRTTSLHHRHRQLTSETPNPRKRVLLISCFSTSFPDKPTRRKNRLRQKILETFRKPIIPEAPPANPDVPIDSSPIQESGNIQEVQESDKSRNSEAGNEEVQEFEEMREVEVSMPAGGSVDRSIGVLAKNSILKYGLWLVGAFVFQTVCATWVFGSAGVDNKNELFDGDEKNSVLEVGGNEGKSRVRIVLNGKMGVENSALNSIIYVDELEMERKIEEIRAMARKAREKERLESKTNGFEGEDNEETNGGRSLKSGIEEEVDNRLDKLRKKLENARKKIPVASVGYSRKEKDEVEKGELDETGANGAFLFKKKYKFKGSASDPTEKPKGFIGSDDFSVNKSKESGNGEKGYEYFQSGNHDNDAVSLGDGENQPQLSGVDPKGSDAVKVVEEDRMKGMSEMTESSKTTRKKVGKERGTSKRGKGKGEPKPKVIDVEAGKSNAEAVRSRKSSAQNMNEEKLSTDSLKGKGFGVAKSAVKRNSETDFWWSKLPYVLAILMQRGHDGPGEGLYTLKNISSAEDRISHVVAFEDRADANNFCYLLQSFFEDLEDFKADVVPLTVKEVNEAVESNTMRVIVVKKGQLKLYAGQPLVDAETALRALI
ncbi:uncharacterized protein LOC105171522 isoform X2 [Sesamum indicum]|uniref:Uncharacterized protein LOC105171522 isoform X2 n=1 Tax=Sesamum indicum TaxID=4182 RepID=A0A6I9U0L9_SESIN|nr:uncharacterized protein LOC105171522 isoform X2 [Sesamum indicum]